MATTRSSSIKKIAKVMRSMDFCMLTTVSADGEFRARPMSNNGEVEFDGDVWFFSASDSRKIQDIEGEPRVHLSFADPATFSFISLTGNAEVVRDNDKKNELWLEELERWFPDGPESDDVVLIKVVPTVVAYWNQDGDDEVTLTE